MLEAAVQNTRLVYILNTSCSFNQQNESFLKKRKERQDKSFFIVTPVRVEGFLWAETGCVSPETEGAESTEEKGKKQYQYQSWNDRLRKQSRCRILAEAQPFEGLALGLEFIPSLSL